MASIESTLYPPILSTYQAAFVASSTTSSCKIYFSLSSYNSLTSIAAAHVKVTHQNNNASALDDSFYPCDIKVCSIGTDSTVSGDAKYYITLNATDMANGFQIGEYYKVQIRFSSITSSSYTAEWFTENTSSFSEWSTITLIKAIGTPSININEIESESVLTVSSLDLVGTVAFEDDTSEILDNYQVVLYDNDDNILVQSGVLYSSAYSNLNEIHYSIPYEFQNGNRYRIRVSIVTNNLYTMYKDYNFITIQDTSGTLDIAVTVTPQEEIGALQIDIDSTSGTKFMGNLNIRRASSEDNFTLYYDIKKITVSENKILDLTWLDCSVKSGVYYKYAVEQIKNTTSRTAAVTSEPAMVLFEDMFLNADNRQLRLRYDQQVSSYKRTVSDAKTETIGSKYPFIKRNGYMNYRTFSISGLITFQNEFDLLANSEVMGEDSIGHSASGSSENYLAKAFATRNSIFGSQTDRYTSYNSNNNINSYNDYIFEREYREKVIDFLYTDNIKLFRSLPEGNILVRLTDISLTPKTELGRYIYSFTATANEIDDLSVENIDSYGIQTIGEFSDTIKYTYELQGQVADTFAANQDIKSYIESRYTTQTEETETTITIESFNTVLIEISDAPYGITGTAGNLHKTASNETPFIYGFLINLNSIPTIINSAGIYYLSDDASITTVSFPVATNAVISYNITVSEENKSTDKEVKTYNYLDRVGQIWRVFDTSLNTESAYSEIYSKYYIDTNTTFSRITSLDALWIEGAPGTIVYIEETRDSAATKFVLDENGKLNLFDDDVSFNNIYFAGLRILNTEIISATNAASVTTPYQDRVYQFADGTYHVYHRANWYDVTTSTEQGETVYESDCPVEAIVNYYCEIAKGEYQT